jgi:phosphopantothenoylcysteine decarboxylase/phosphopantothenate--cysteine ligase
MLTDKNVDLVVYNDVGRDDVGFESQDNEVVLVSEEGERTVAKAPKTEIAREILDEVERLLEERA